MEARCVKWAGQVITDGLERSRRTREDVHIMAVSHGAFISARIAYSVQIHVAHRLTLSMVLRAL